MVTAIRTRLSMLAKSEEGALQSPVPEDEAEAKLPASDGVNGSGKSGDDESDPCESGGTEAVEIFTTSTKCEGEESVTEIAGDAVVDPHQMESVYGDVLSHLIALPFEAQSMLRFHQRKESSKDGKSKRKKSSRKNAIPIYSQKQYLRGAGLMSLSSSDLTEKEIKKKRKVKSSPSRGPSLHSNRSECAEFSPRSVKTLESPKRGVSQSPRQQNATTNDDLNSHLNQNIAALREQALAQTQQQQQLFIDDHRNFASLQQEHELQLLLQQQQQQQPTYYDPLQSVHQHLYHQMLMTSYSFNPYLPYQQPGYQQISPQLLQPLLHGGYVNNPDEVLMAALRAADSANQNDPLPRMSNGFVAHPNNDDTATLATEAANQNSHLPLTSNDFVSTAAPPAGNHNSTTADLLGQMKAGVIAPAAAEISTSVATDSSKQNLTMSNKQDVAASAVPQAFEQNLDNVECEAKRTIQDKDAVSKMKPKKAAARSKKVAKRKKQTKASIEKAEVKNNSKSARRSGEKRNEKHGDNRIGISDEVDFPPGWTTSTQPRKTGRGFNVHYVSPTNNIFRSRNNAMAFIAILKELKKKNGGKDPSESEALAVFDRRGHKR